MKVGEAGDDLRDIAAGSIDLNGNGDGVAVVFDGEDDGQLQIGGDAEGLPELALAGGTLANGDIDDLVAVELNIFIGTVVAVMLGGGLGVAREVAAGIGAADGLQALRGGGRAGRDDVELAAGPVRGHLTAAAGGVVSRADGLQQLLLGGVAESEAESAVAVVGEEPVVAGLHGEGGGDEERLMAGTGDLEEDLLLALEHDFAVVGAAREVHEAVNLDELLARQRGFAVPGLLNFGGDRGLGHGFLYFKWT